MKLHVESEGKGREVVLLHGWGMHCGYWKAVSDPLSKRFRVHLVDLPGHGLSRSWKGDWVDILAECFPCEVSICGWSLGGQLAMEWAWKYPERVSKLALVSSTPSFVMRNDWIHGISREVFMAFHDGVGKNAKETLRRFLFLQIQGGKEGRALLRKLQLELKETEMEELENGLDLLQELDLRTKAKSLSQPVLIIHGEGDRLAPVGAGKWLAENLNNAKLEIIPDCAHAPILSHPDFCFSKLAEFLDGH